MSTQSAPESSSDSAFVTGPARGLTPNVLKLGLVALLSDISSEMLYPIIPIFLTQILGAPVAALGLIEGVAAAIASGLKAYFGRLSDRLPHRRGIIVYGYGISALAKPIIALAQAWPLVFVARGFDRFGKAMRASPRDALLAESVEDRYLGKAFGWHRGFDSIGAILGPLLALPFLHAGPSGLRRIFLWALIPGLASAAGVLFVHEKEKPTSVSKESTPRYLDQYPRIYWSYLLTWGLFSLGNSSDMFLILRAKDIGLSMVQIILIYTGYNTVYAFASPWLGQLSDHIPRHYILRFGFLVFAGVYAGFAFATKPWQIVGLYLLYGIYAAGTDGVGKAMALDYIPAQLRGSGLGLLGALTSACTLFASIAAGILWTSAGARAPFIYGALAAGLAALTLRRKRFA